MIFIYDLKLNFKNNFIDFFEWNKDDLIIKVKKVLVFKISDVDVYNLKYGTIKIDDVFLKKIYKKTSIYLNSKIQFENYTTIFCSDQSMVAVRFDKNGVNKMKSDIDIEEQDRIINTISKVKKIKLDYKIIKNGFISFKTRLEKDNKYLMIKELNKIYSRKEFDKINYIFAECFSEQDGNITYKIKKIKKEIIKGSDNFYKIFNIFKLISQNN